MTRANRISVTIENGQFVARVYRTHKHLATIAQGDTTFASTTENKNTQREEYKDHIAQIVLPSMGLFYQPEDQRTADNLRKASYATDADLEEDATHMVWADVAGLVSGVRSDLHLDNLVVDQIVPKAVTPTGRLLSDLGVEDGKYLKSGKWAWATLSLMATVVAEGHTETPIFVPFQMELVSGQLKKPTALGDAGFTKTAWAATLTKEMKALGLVEAETSAPAAQQEAQTPPTEERKLSKKELRALEAQAAQEAMAR